MPFRLTSIFATTIIITGTRGRCLMRNVNVGHNKLLSQGCFSDEDRLVSGIVQLIILVLQPTNVFLILSLTCFSMKNL